MTNFDSLLVQKRTPNAIVPTVGSARAAGYDLYAALTEDVIIKSGSRALVSTGISIGLPEGTYGRVAPRSGLAVKYGLDVGAGVIDQDYTGLVQVVLFNFGEKDYTVRHGDRIAQLIITPCVSANVVEVGALKESTRGSGGFGSTGI